MTSLEEKKGKLSCVLLLLGQTEEVTNGNENQDK